MHSVEVMQKFMAGMLPEPLSPYAAERISQICGSFDKKRYTMLVLAMLLHDVAKPEVMTVDEQGEGHFSGHPEQSAKTAGKVLKRLTYDNETIDTVVRLIRYHDYRMETTMKSVRRAASKIGRDIMWMEFVVQYADVLSQSPQTIPEKLEKLDQCMEKYQEIEAKSQPLSVKDLAVNGRDLIRAGIAPGPGLGQKLSQLLDLVLEEPELNTREQLLERIKE